MSPAQMQQLLPELTFVNAVLRKAKDREAMMKRIMTAIDWEAVDDAGNNLDAAINAVRAGVRRL